jgi:hypothetical protein
MTNFKAINTQYVFLKILWSSSEIIFEGKLVSCTIGSLRDGSFAIIRAKVFEKLKNSLFQMHKEAWILILFWKTIINYKNYMFYILCFLFEKIYWTTRLHHRHFGNWILTNLPLKMISELDHPNSSNFGKFLKLWSTLTFK